MISLYKGKGAKTDGNSYRGISIMQALAKLYSHLVLRLFVDATKSRKLHKRCPSGFQKKHRLKDNIQLPMCAMQVAKAMGRRVVSVFMDLQKAHDHIDRKILM